MRLARCAAILSSPTRSHAIRGAASCASRGIPDSAESGNIACNRIAGERRLAVARETLFATVLGEFDRLSSAEKAREALLAAGVPGPRISLGENAGETWLLSVYAESSFERGRIQSLLQQHGALHTEQREG